ncbi:hypothetical protein MEQU1_000766 [Malassezia equina]|uniref:J domain-containing protein n=1 Tax=Malassezia equina TaxID=1381935 RepID=A0AAF0IXP1_9BASI|nr:hypothetical protein MEQU1_000766 [Malassezia equina]
MWHVLWVAVLATILLPVAQADKSSTDWLRQANAALTSFDYAGALEAFDHAIELDPSAYLSYFRRATAQQALGRTKAALEDLEATIQRSPTFGKAYLQQARIELKEGNLDQALRALKSMEKHGAAHAEKDKSQVADLRSHVQQAQGLRKKLDKKSYASPEDCLRMADELLKLAPNDLTARKQHAECALQQGDLDTAVIDWTRLVHLAPAPALQLRLSMIAYYLLGTKGSQMQDAGLAHLKSCLHNDPDNKACIRAHKQLRKIDKALQKARKFAESDSWSAVSSALKGAKVGGPTIYEEIQAVLQEGLDSQVLPAQLQDPAARSLLLQEIEGLYCQAYVEQNLIRKAMPWCDKLLVHDPNNVPALIAKGEEKMSQNEFEEAVRIFSQAMEHAPPTDRSVHARILKAQKLLKQAKSKDYYKVLGVSRDADDRTIKKAYRRLAREYHPDKGGSQEKMAEINEAFGVLNDPELKARYDQGDDPNDPTGGQEGGFGHPFAGQGHPFAGQGHPFAGQGHPFAQFFQQGHFQHGGGGQQFHFSF